MRAPTKILHLGLLNLATASLLLIWHYLEGWSVLLALMTTFFLGVSLAFFLTVLIWKNI